MASTIVSLEYQPFVIHYFSINIYAMEQLIGLYFRFPSKSVFGLNHCKYYSRCTPIVSCVGT